MPQGLFKEGRTQLRPGPVTSTSDPKDPLSLGGVGGEPPADLWSSWVDRS